MGLAVSGLCSWESPWHHKKGLVDKEVGPNPTDRGKPGTKRNVLTDGSGIPISITVCSANKHDKTQVVNVLDALMLTPPETEQHICLDNGYDYPDIRQELTSRGYKVHIPLLGLDTEQIPPKGDPDRHPARRWVVERCHAWLHKFRKILVRYERLPQNYLALLQFACCLIIYRKLLT